MDYSQDPNRNTSINARLNDIFNVEEPDVPSSLEQVVDTDLKISQSPEEELQDDLDKARLGLRNLIDKGTELVEKANFFAVERQDAKSVEAAALAQGTARENIMALIKMHQLRKDITKDTDIQHGDTNITNTAVYVGTTGDLLRLSRDMNADVVLQRAIEGKVIEANTLNNDEDDDSLQS